MKNFKKIMAILLVVALTAAASIAGTLAYLSDTDDDVNIMTVGNVKIQQNEQQRVEKDGEFTDELENYAQGKLLMPVTYPGNRTADTVTIGDHEIELSDKEANYVDKIISVTNTGISSAYVRTLVAVPTGGEDWEPNPVSANDCWLHWNIPTEYDDYWELNATPTLVDLGGQGYYVWEFVHKDALAAGKTTYPAVRGFYLDQKVNNDDSGFFMTYDDGTVKRIEDVPFNDTVDVLVLSQAVQTAGFTDAKTALNTAFGNVTKETAGEWFSDLANVETVSSSEELAAAIADGATTIFMKEGTYQMPAAAKGKTLTIIGADPEDVVIEVVPAGQDEANGQLDYSLDGSNVTFENVTIKTNSQLYAGYARLSGTYKNCVIRNTYNLGTGNSEFIDCEFNITNEYLRVGGAYSATFDNCTFNTDGRAILVFQDGTSVAQTVTVKDCTFNATAAANTWNGIHVAAVSIDGTSGTYTVNLEGTNTVDSDFNGLWQIKAGEANVTVNE